jgi:general secretion pathway protein B
MSLLLDALNKADEERKRGDGPPTIDSHHNDFDAQAKHKIPRTFVILIVIMTLVSLLAAVYWLGKNTHQESTEALSLEASQLTVSQQTDSSKTAEADIGTNNNNSATNGQTLGDRNITADNKTINSNTAKANIKMMSQEKIPDAESVATLYQQQTNDNLPLQERTPLVNRNEPDTVNPSNQNAQNTNAPNSIKQFANIPEIQDLPNDILNNLPSLKYTEHHYNSNGGSVVINGVVKHVNEELAPGLVIDKILEDGIILHLGNYSFKMRALNTWMNM